MSRHSADEDKKKPVNPEAGGGGARLNRADGRASDTKAWVPRYSTARRRAGIRNRAGRPERGGMAGLAIPLTLTASASTRAIDGPTMLSLAAAGKNFFLIFTFSFFLRAGIFFFVGVGG